MALSLNCAFNTVRGHFPKPTLDCTPLHDRLIEAEIADMTPDLIMHELGRDDIFPKAAMAAAGKNREAMVPLFNSLLTRLGSQTTSEFSDADLIALIPVAHLLAEWREARAYRAFLGLMRRPLEALDHFGDTVAVSYRIAAGLFDGDPSPFFEAIEDKGAWASAQSNLFAGLLLIAQEHPDHRPEIEAFIRRFGVDHRDAPPELQMGWMEAVIDFGLEDMKETVRALFDRGIITGEFCQFSDFEAAMQKALDTHERSSWWAGAEDLITDAIEELSYWHCYSDEFFRQRKRENAEKSRQTAPSTGSGPQPIRKIGRNDPCPCGSGKKYKKCCLNRPF